VPEVKLRKIIAVAALCSIAACGSAADGTTFNVPSNYVTQTSLGPFMQIWASGDKKSTLMLFAIPRKLDLSKAHLHEMNSSMLENEKDAQVKAITICGDQPAMFVDASGQVNTGDIHNPHPKHVEFVMTGIGGKTYMAMYARPIGAGPDPAAEAAIKHVCQKTG